MALRGHAGGAFRPAARRGGGRRRGRPARGQLARPHDGHCGTRAAAARGPSARGRHGGRAGGPRARARRGLPGHARGDGRHCFHGPRAPPVRRGGRVAARARGRAPAPGPAAPQPGLRGPARRFPAAPLVLGHGRGPAPHLLLLRGRAGRAPGQVGRARGRGCARLLPRPARAPAGHAAVAPERCGPGELPLRRPAPHAPQGHRPVPGPGLPARV
mmetsp:Transcript_6155/g.21054  ORF Transcript_6155/g.21054 Transcript_6155/m.21054 type:complete len:215 (-) Transcript_6155:151-795(-)